LKIGCQGGEMSKWKHEPLKVNFPPFLGGVRPKKIKFFSNLQHQTEYAFTTLSTNILYGELKTRLFDLIESWFYFST
jgi:hypothetical protein